MFAPDADFVNVTGQWWRGRDEIRRNHAFTHGTQPTEAAPVTLPERVYGIFKNSSTRFDRVEVKFVDPDTATAHGAWTKLGDARSAEARHGIMTFVLVREGDRWLYAAAQNTEVERRVP